MPNQSAGDSMLVLRDITRQLAASKPLHLPAIVPQLVRLLASCRPAFISPQTQTNLNGEDSVILHKYRAQLTTLLFGKSPEGRWSAVVLIKATLYKGEWTMVQACEPWVRGLLAILGKSDPTNTKSLAIVTLVSIFTLTRPYHTLMREVTTPSIPAFIAACVKLTKLDSSHTSRPSIAPQLLQTILEAFGHLVPNHPTLFRPSISQIHSILLSILVPASSHPKSGSDLQRDHFTSSWRIKLAARQLFVLLHYCAPKNSSSETWRSLTEKLLLSAHITSDQVFRAVVEDWEPIKSGMNPGPTQNLSDAATAGLDTDVIGLPGWTGIHNGIQRLVALIELIGTSITVQTAAAVAMPIGLLLDILVRVFMITVPPSKNTGRAHTLLRMRPEIERDEKDGLWAGIPQIHVAALGLLSTLVHRLGNSFVPLSHGILDLVCDVFKAEHYDPYAGLDFSDFLFILSANIYFSNIRTAVYLVVSDILTLPGEKLPKESLIPLTFILNKSCDDLLSASPDLLDNDGPPTRKVKTAVSIEADKYLPSKDTPEGSPPCLSGLNNAASKLLPLILSSVATENISFALRSKAEKSAILTHHKQAMISGVISPFQSKKARKHWPSIIPHLARTFSHAVEVEGLLRPRMPVLSGFKRAEEDTISESGEASGSGTPSSDFEGLRSKERLHDFPLAEEKSSLVEFLNQGIDSSGNSELPSKPVGLEEKRSDPLQVPHAESYSSQKRERTVEDVDGSSTQNTPVLPEKGDLPLTKRSRSIPALGDQDNASAEPLSPGNPSQSGVLLTMISFNSEDQNDGTDDEFDIPELALKSDTDEDGSDEGTL
ncbi:MAG: hypothetical protein M1829_001727 [Trizodia sp. TS-e1964]|nr:MAG: hypothetical protein M1829_001727 [Trizodia sp. TS-e1964]